MAVTGKSLWQRLSLVHPSSEVDTVEGLKLFREYTHRGYLNADWTDRSRISEGAIVDFFRRLALLRSASSPVCRRHDARWMSSCDFQFYQIHDAGSFFRAIIELPFLRTDGIILLPVTRIQKGFPLSPVSHSILDPGLSEPMLSSYGFSLEDQFRLFLAAAHLTGLKVGYYLSPLIAPDSAVIYRRPEFFLWRKEGQDSAQGEDIAEEVLRITEEDFKITGEYNYSRIREKVKENSLAVLQVPDEKDAVCFNLDNGDCREYFADIFLNLQIRYPLDFIYLSLPESMNGEDAGKTVRLVQTPGKGTLKKYTGWIVDHPVSEFEEDFQRITNLFSCRTLSLSPMTEERFHEWFHFLGDLYEINKGRKVAYSRAIPLSVDNVDLPEALKLYFLARFSGISNYRRPLLLDTGFLNDREFRAVQNRIEDVYTRYIDLFAKGSLLKVVADDRYAWWLLRDRTRILIALISLEAGDSVQSLPEIRIDYSEFIRRSKTLTVVEYDFSSSQGDLYLSADNSLIINNLNENGFRLFSLQ